MTLRLMGLACLLLGCSQAVGPETDNASKATVSPSAEHIAERDHSPASPSTAPPALTSAVKVKGRHGGTTVDLLPEKINVEILVSEGEDMVIVLGILRATSIQDLKFVRQNAEGQAPEEFTGEMKSQFGISESWVFTSRRLVELLKEGRDGKVSLTASTSSGPQAASEFLDVEITWPAPKSNEK